MLEHHVDLLKHYVDHVIGLVQTHRIRPMLSFFSDSLRLSGGKGFGLLPKSKYIQVVPVQRQFSSERGLGSREASALNPLKNTMPTCSTSQSGVLTSKHLFDRSASRRHCGRKDARNINIGYRPQRPSYPPGPAIINSPFRSRSRHRIYTSAAAVTSITPQCSHSHGRFRLACEACKSCKNYSIR